MGPWIHACHDQSPVGPATASARKRLRKEPVANLLLVNTLTDFKGVNVVALCGVSAILKAAEHQVRLMDRALPVSLAAKADRALDGFAPDIIAINVMTSHQVAVLREVSSLLSRRCPAPIIAGGMAVSADPEAALACPCVDAACVGEGDGAILDVIERGDARL